MMRNDRRPMGRTDWILLAALSLLWGGSFFFFKVLVAELPPLTIVFWRVALASAALLAFVYATGRRMPADLRVWGAFAVMGLLNNVVPFALIAWGEREISSGLASILNATTPIFTVLFASALTKDERLTAARLGGVLLGILGVAVLIGPEAIRRLNLTSAAQLAVVAAALSYGLANIFGRRFGALGLSPIVTATGQVCSSSLIALPLMLALDRPWTFAHAPSLAAIASLAGIAILCTAVAYALFFRILASAGATNVSLVTFLVPLTALLLGIGFLHERLAWTSIAGMAAIFAGLALIDGRLFARRVAQPASPAVGTPASTPAPQQK
jgi:drug/metabolite transporter (DMT)-like permease